MPAINIRSKRMATLIESRQISMAIRNRKKDDFTAPFLHVWYNQKKVDRRKLFSGIYSASNIIITDTGYNNITNTEDLNDFAEALGYSSWNSLIRYFKMYHKLPYTGLIIIW